MCVYKCKYLYIYCIYIVDMYIYLRNVIGCFSMILKHSENPTDTDGIFGMAHKWICTTMKITASSRTVPKLLHQMLNYGCIFCQKKWFNCLNLRWWTAKNYIIVTMVTVKMQISFFGLWLISLYLQGLTIILMKQKLAQNSASFLSADVNKGTIIQFIFMGTRIGHNI